MNTEPRPFTPKETAETLQSVCAILHAELTVLPSPVLRWHPAPEEWCIQQVVGHLIAAEKQGFAGRIRAMLANPDPQLVPSDHLAAVLDRRDSERDVNDLLNEFDLVRRDSCDLVAGLSETDLRRGGRHPAVGYLTVADLLQEWIYHDRNHLRQIMDNIQHFVWPHMGNTKHFYGL